MTALFILVIIVYLTLPAAFCIGVWLMSGFHKDLDESIKEANKNLEDK